jgi:hypothetical protein
MVDHAGANHVQINVHQTPMQVLIGLNSRSMISVFPERTLPPFALIVLLRGSPGDELHALSDNIGASISDQQMNVIRCHRVVEHAETKALLGLEKLV